jgi:hypothetical protein
MSQKLGLHQVLFLGTYIYYYFLCNEYVFDLIGIFSYKLLGVLVVLDACPDGIIYERLVPDYVDFVRTIYEGSMFFMHLFCYFYPFFLILTFTKLALLLYIYSADDFGQVVADVNYLNIENTESAKRIFIC